MGKDNKCKVVHKKNLNGVERIGCSVCGSIFGDAIPTICPTCKRHVKNAKYFK